MLDQVFFEEENKILKELVKHYEKMYDNLRRRYEEDMKNSDNHWKEMYENLFKRYEDVVNDYDKLVMETVKRDLPV